MPPKCLLSKPLPENLPTVAACAPCNGGFSKDEQYFLLVLSQITNDAGLLDAADRMLDKSAKLEGALLKNIVVADNRRVHLNVDLKRTDRIIRKIACGIFAYRYRRVVPLSSIGPIEYSPHQPPVRWAVMAHTEKFTPKRWTRIGRGFSYLIAKEGPTGGRLCCLMDFYGTLFAAAFLPAVGGGREPLRRVDAGNNPELPFK